MFPHNHIGTIKPHEAMMYAISMLIWPSTRADNLKRGMRSSWRYARPGAVIEMMPQKWREKLKDLKSEDFDKMWFDHYCCDEKWFRKKDHSKMLMEFDKKLGVKA